MADTGRTTKKKIDRPAHERGRPGTDAEGRQNLTPEAQPDAERGERLQTGKAIARGGKTRGPVPGAEESR